MKRYIAARKTVLQIIVAFSLTAAPCQPANQAVPAISGSPQDKTGVWEEDDGNGGAIGIDIDLTTQVQGTPAALRGVLQYPRDVFIGVYHRHGTTRSVGDTAWLSSNQLLLGWNAGRIKSSDKGEAPHLDVDLKYDAMRDRWIGHIRWAAASRDVQLIRPAAKSGVPRNNLAGDWRENTAVGFRCFHVALQANGGVEGWFDTVVLPGAIQFAKGVNRPLTTQEQYGQQGVTTLLDANTLSFQTNAYGAGCCANTFTGKLTRSGTVMRGAWSSGSANAAQWLRAADRTCMRF